MLTLTPLLLACVPQCVDPAVPPGGFAIMSALDQLVTFSDGATTRADVRRPSAAPGACGWPMLVLVHGIGGNKASLNGSAQSFAAQGYFSLTFDVRGHATHSGGHTHFGQRERFDQMELMRWAIASFAGVVDGSRIGVNGASQGGSTLGRPPPGAERRSRPMPGASRATTPTSTRSWPTTPAPTSRPTSRRSCSACTVPAGRSSSAAASTSSRCSARRSTRRCVPRTGPVLRRS
ncbi:MAG: hypothetical protein FJ294_08195 [Planctomycetes bacterium]|nr:hypothetical protein [Planctomycetota bacterium]